MEGKFFATTKANATLWGSRLNSNYIVSMRVAKSRNLSYYKGLPGYTKFEKFLGKGLTSRLGWANNYHYVKSVMNHGGIIWNNGGALSGSYLKELILIGHYPLFF